MTLSLCLCRLFGTKCSKCGLGFSKNDFVMRARSKIYHIDCFRCVACSRQLIPGDEFALREDGLFCKADHDVVERAQAGDSSALSPGSDCRGSLTPLGGEYFTLYHVIRSTNACQSIILTLRCKFKYGLLYIFGGKH